MHMLEGHKEASSVSKGIQEIQRLSSQMAQLSAEPKESATMLQAKTKKCLWDKNLKKKLKRVKYSIERSLKRYYENPF